MKPSHLSVVTSPGALPVEPGIQARAARLYPDDAYLQREWLRAVAVVRATRNGWHLDRPVERKQ